MSGREQASWFGGFFESLRGRLLCICRLVLAVVGVAAGGAAGALAQGGSISGQVISPAGYPVAYATVRICPTTSTGTPCTPLTTGVYADPALTQPVANPYTTDGFGNYSVFVAANLYYIVQVSFVSNQQTYTYTYLVDAPGSGGGSGGSPSSPNGSVQVNNNGSFGGIPATTATTGIFLLGDGDSRMAGSTLATSAAHLNNQSGAAPYNAGALGNQDLLSRIAQQPNFKNRTLGIYNNAQGGTNCAQMTTNYATFNISKYAPGASSGPATGGVTYDFILTEQNDAAEGTTLIAYQACMKAYLNTETAVGISPVLITGYIGSSNSFATNNLMESYNTWLKTLAGSAINGVLVRVIDADSYVSHTLGDTDWQGIVNQTNTVYTVSNTVVASCGTNCTQVTLTVAGTGNTIYFGQFPAELGGFQTSTFLNYQKASTYVSGAGTNTIVLQTDAPLPIGTYTEPGYVWLWQQPYPAGLHLGADGANRLAAYVNDAFGLSGTGTRSAQNITQDIFNPPSQKTTIYGSLMVTGDSTDIFSGTATALPGTMTPGQMMIMTTPQVGAPGGGTTPFYPGNGLLFFGGKATAINANPGATQFLTPIYTGTAGAIGQVTVYSAGSGYVVGDVVTIGGAGTGGTATVSSVTSSGGVTGISATAPGASYNQASNVATTGGTGSGLTLNVFPSASAPFELFSDGAYASGGTFTACGYGVPCSIRGRTGYLQSITGGTVTTLTLGAGGSGYTSGTVTLVQSGASGGTASITTSNTSVTAFSVTASGTGYSTANGLATTCVSGTCGGTGLTVNVGQTYAGGGLYGPSTFVNSGGSNFTVGDVYAVVQSGASGGQITISTVANGVVTAVSLTTGGYNYQQGTVTFTGGGGSGATLNITAINQSAGGFCTGASNCYLDTGNGATWQPSGTISINHGLSATALTATGLSTGLVWSNSGLLSPVTLTTTGTSGASTFSAGTLNIPQYSGGTGSGSVTSFSAGTLAPLFTTNVATPTTTPALTFALTNAAANTAFGNFTGSAGAPSYTATTGTGSPVAATSPTIASPTFTGTATAANLTVTGTCTGCGGTGLSGQTTGYLPKATSATASTTSSAIDDSVTTASTVTVHEAMAVQASGPSQLAITYNSTAVVPGSATTAVFGVNSAGQGVMSEAGGAASEICDATNGVCGSGSFSSLTGGTNTTAAMLVGTGASLGTTGTGTINATQIDGVTVTGTPTSGQVPTATSGTAATWQTPASGSGTVNSGTANQLAYYATTGTAVSGDPAITDNGTLVTVTEPFVDENTNNILYAADFPGADMSVQLTNCLVALYAISTKSGECQFYATSSTVQTVSQNFFAAAGSPGTTYPTTGRILLCGFGVIDQKVPMVKQNNWRIEGCGNSQGAGAGSQMFTADASAFPSSIVSVSGSHGSIASTPATGQNSVWTGTGTAWTSNLVGCLIVAQASMSATENVTTSASSFGIIHSVSSATSLTVGWSQNNGGAPAGSDYAITCGQYVSGDGDLAGSPYTYDGPIKNLGFDCNSVLGCVGIMNLFSEEGFGADNVRLQNYCIGIEDESNYSQNSGPYNHITMFANSSTCGANAISYVTRGSSVNKKGLQNSTLAINGSTALTVAVDEETLGDHLEQLHIENATTAVQIGAIQPCPIVCALPPRTAQNAVLDGINVATSGTTVVALSNAYSTPLGVQVKNVTINAGSSWTNTLTDTFNSCTDTSSRVGVYELSQSGTVQNSTSTTQGCYASPRLSSTYITQSGTATATTAVSSHYLYWNYGWGDGTNINSGYATCQLNASASGTNVASYMDCEHTGSPNFTGWKFGMPVTSTGVVKGTQFNSTVATGTAPFVVASTTQVANLAAATAAALSAASALPNGTTATTQATGDTSTDVATDGFVATAVAAATAGSREYSAYCSGAATASTTLSIQGLGSQNGGCTGTPATGLGFVMPANGTLSNLTVRCTTTGVATNSGVFTLYDIPSGSTTATATALTVTYGNGSVTLSNTSIYDNTHTYAYSKGDVIQLKFTTQASETLSGCMVGFNY